LRAKRGNLTQWNQSVGDCRVTPFLAMTTLAAWLGRTALDAKQGIGRTKLEDAGQQWHDTHPTPDDLRPNKDQTDQGKTHNDTKYSIDSTYVAHNALLHD